MPIKEEISQQLLLSVFMEAGVKEDIQNKRKEASQFLTEKGINPQDDEWRAFFQKLDQIEDLRMELGRIEAAQTILGAILGAQNEDEGEGTELSLKLPEMPA